MISEILETNGFYSDTDIVLFESKVTFRNLLKDEILVKPGDVCNAIYFTIAGAVYQYNYIDEFQENVIDLHLDHEWFLNDNSFISQKPSVSFIKAYTDSKILELNIESLHYLIGKSPAFLQLGRIFEQATSRVRLFDNRLTPTQKYQHILDHRPDLIQKFPLKCIASYLKITPETLSRVRESFSKRKIVS